MAKRVPVVLFVSTLEPTTGGEVYLVKVRDYLQDRGVPVVVINLEHLPVWIRRQHLFINLLLTNFWFLAQVLSIRERQLTLFEDFHYHSRLFLLNWLVRLFKRVKIVALTQLTLYYHPVLRSKVVRWIDEKLVRFFFHQADHVLANSQCTKNEVVSLGVHPERVTVTYGAFQRLNGERINRRNYAEDEQPIQILAVGRCSPDKGYDVLLEATKRLMPPYDLQVHIVGDVQDGAPEYYGQLLNSARAAGLEEAFLLHGHIADKGRLKELYRAANIFALPSRVEGLGVVLLEAMSFGMPVVATRVGGIPELVKDGENGLLIQPDDPVALKMALEQLICSTALREKLGRRGFVFVQEVEEQFSWKRVLERTCNEPLDLDNYQSSCRISPRKGKHDGKATNAQT